MMTIDGGGWVKNAWNGLAAFLGKIDRWLKKHHIATPTNSPI